MALRTEVQPARGHADGVARSDQATMRRANMGLVLAHLRDRGPRSRATLAAETGLSKATVTDLVADLTARGLVSDGSPHRSGAVGRPGRLVTLTGTHICGLGIEINVDYLAVSAVDLSGTIVREQAVPLDTRSTSAPELEDAVADLIDATRLSLVEQDVQPVALTVGAPGVINPATGSVVFAPNLGWERVSLVADLSRRSPWLSAVPVLIENDAKLGAVAEYALVTGTPARDLLFLSGHVGVGAGIIAGGRLLRGASGFAGEVGHLPLDPRGLPCRCGRRGCWENAVAYPAFLELVSGPVRGAGSPPALEAQLNELRRRAEAGDRAVLDALATVTAQLVTGLSILVDVLDPDRIVLGGYFGYFGELLTPGVADALADQRLVASGKAVQIVPSNLGLAAAARGGAHLALATVFQDPALVAERR